MRSARFSSCLARFAHDREGNIAIIFALALLPMTFAVGMGIDYANGARRRSQLNAAADAAALAAVTPAMMSQSDAAAKTAATNMFLAQVANISGLNFSPSNLQVTITDAGLARNVVVNYSASSQNAFSGIVGKTSTTFSGSSSSSSAVAPNIDFYLLLDSSPSMAIAATTADIQTMVNHTSSQGGCAFACHESNPASDNLGNPGGEDNFALSQNLGVTLRIDLLRAAAQNLVPTAQQAATTYNSSYRMALYTFDIQLNTIQALTTNLSTIQTQAGNIKTLEVYNNDCLTQSNCNNDTDTNYDAAMTGINSIMPTPGNGTNTKGDTPQEVLFLVTDGVEDEMVTTTTTTTKKGKTTTTTSSNRVINTLNNDLCTTIKNRGIKIAVLYTTYFPLPTNSFYVQNVAPFQPQIGPNLTSCASSGLYAEVSTDGDISGALQTLFNLSVQQARLTK